MLRKIRSKRGMWRKLWTETRIRQRHFFRKCGLSNSVWFFTAKLIPSKVPRIKMQKAKMPMVEYSKRLLC